MRVIPSSSAAAIPRSVVAAREMMMGIPAWAYLITISRGCLPVHPTTHAERGMPFWTACPITLSTVLCRPTSLLLIRILPSWARTEQCTPPVWRQRSVSISRVMAKTSEMVME